MFRMLIYIVLACPLVFAESYKLDNLTWHRSTLSKGEIAEIKCKEWLKNDDTIEKVGKQWRIEYGDREEGHADIELAFRNSDRIIFIKDDSIFRITISLDFFTMTFVACYEIGNAEKDNQFTIYTGEFAEL